MNLDNYEEGALQGFVSTEKKWWQFWKPKRVYGDVGVYTKIGNVVQVVINGGYSFTHKEDEQNLTRG